MQTLRRDRHWEESRQEDDAPNAISAWKSKDGSKDRNQMGRNNGKPGRKTPITSTNNRIKKGQKDMKQLTEKDIQRLKNTGMEACLKGSKIPFLTRHLNTLHYAKCVRVWGNGSSFLVGGGVN